MQTSAPLTSQPGRPFVGFERECSTYEGLKDELLRTAVGKYIVIVGDEILGPCDSFGDALRIGYRRFGPGPLYVKQIMAAELVAEVSREIVPCPI